MAFYSAVVTVLFYAACATCGPQSRRFPEGFIFGVASSAYQIEGAWNVDGKTESVWDRITHTQPFLISDGSNGDVAADSYYLYKRDIEMLRELGVDFYRFSLSWTRILPSGFPDYINEPGVRYYNNLINELLSYNIQPVVTIFHWDLPQSLQDLGGWTNPSVVEWYANYARVVFSLFGDRVKLFATLNEPKFACVLYSFRLDRGTAVYSCIKNALLAHATAYHIYDEEFRAAQGGRVFIVNSIPWYEPGSQADADMDAARDAIQFNWEVYTHPIFSKTGDFPEAMKKRIAAKSAEQGYPKSRLPEFTPEEIEYVKGTSDYFGVNHYTTYYVSRNESVPRKYDVIPSFEDDLDVVESQPTSWRIGDSNGTLYAPWGFSKLLDYIKETYQNPSVFITENGFTSHGGLQDLDRVKYYRGYLGAVLDSMDNGCDIRGYTAWSLMDNFEWVSGYTECYGLYEVDFNSDQRTRTPRVSAYMYKEIVRSRQLDLEYRPDTSRPITIDPGHS